MYESHSDIRKSSPGVWIVLFLCCLQNCLSDPRASEVPAPRRQAVKQQSKAELQSGLCPAVTTDMCLHDLEKNALMQNPEEGNLLIL